MHDYDDNDDDDDDDGDDGDDGHDDDDVKPSSCMIFSLCIFLSAIKVCRQQIVQWILSCNLKTILFANLFYQSMCWLLPCLVLYNSVSANCHQHKTI